MMTDRERELACALEDTSAVADHMEDALDAAQAPDVTGLPWDRIRLLGEWVEEAHKLLREARGMMPPPYTKWDNVAGRIDRHLESVKRLRAEHPPEEREARQTPVVPDGTCTHGVSCHDCVTRRSPWFLDLARDAERWRKQNGYEPTP